MVNPTWTWHLCPTFDLEPPLAENLKLGDIIISKAYEDIRVPLNRFDRPFVSGIQEPKPRTTSHIVKQGSGGSVGFSARIAQLAGLGPEASMRWSNTRETQYRFEKEHDMFFEPSIETIQDAVTASTAVQTYLNGTSFRKPLYMVTGIKWVEGISMKALHGRTRDENVKLEVDATPVGVSLGMGMQGGGSKSVNEEHTAEGGSPFIFAVRLKKLTWDRMGNVRARDHLEGAFLGVETGEDGVAHAWKLSVEEAVADDFDDSESVHLIEDTTGMEAELVYDVE
jgi:hypothetical protein